MTVKNDEFLNFVTSQNMETSETSGKLTLNNVWFLAKCRSLSVFRTKFIWCTNIYIQACKVFSAYFKFLEQLTINKHTFVEDSFRSPLELKSKIPVTLWVAQTLIHFLLTSPCPIDTGRKLNVHKSFRRRPGRLMYVQFTSSVYWVEETIEICTNNLFKKKNKLLGLKKVNLKIFNLQQRKSRILHLIINCINKLTEQQWGIHQVFTS